jgi:hypothetical protein
MTRDYFIIKLYCLVCAHYQPEADYGKKGGPRRGRFTSSSGRARHSKDPR